MVYLLHHLLEESAARFPDKDAVRFEGNQLSYRQLDARANQVAWKLQELGVKRGDRVGIYLSKSIASVISVFAVMKAGAVYVPLDPNAPARRLAYIARNCELGVVLSSSAKLEDLLKFFEHRTPIKSVVLIDEQATELKAEHGEDYRMISWMDVQNCPAEPPEPTGATDTDLAYILYTSGSTGDPKGVMISHRTIFTFINWCFTAFGMSETDRVTSHAPLHFDLSTFDIYVTIKAGGTVVLVPENLTVIPSRFTKLLQDEAITVTYLVPSVLSLLVSYGNLDSFDLSGLRAVLFAGEVFPIKYLRQLVARIPRADYFNLYGPTETNACTFYKVKPSDLAPGRTQPVPIGRACENMEVFAVDKDQELITEPDVEGELWVRGSGVAQGYWGDPSKTAERFTRNPFQSDFEELVYRTGDIVKLDQDRVNWIFVGREDHMVKSRGYRIELGEIEAALYAHDRVKEAAAVAIPDEMLGNRIKAIVVPREENSLTSKQLEEHCLDHLPRYMVPHAFEVREGLPKTSSGKVDRSSLAHN